MPSIPDRLVPYHPTLSMHTPGSALAIKGGRRRQVLVFQHERSGHLLLPSPGMLSSLYPKKFQEKNIISIGSFTKDLKILVCSTNIEIWFLKWKKQKIGKSEQNKLFIC
jgi:hypothetical protein